MINHSDLFNYETFEKNTKVFILILTPTPTQIVLLFTFACLPRIKIYGRVIDQYSNPVKDVGSGTRVQIHTFLKVVGEAWQR